MTTRLEHDLNGSFWEVTRDGTEVRFRFGPIGQSGQTRTKSFPDRASAAKAVDAGIASMKNAGFRRVIAATRSPTVGFPATLYDTFEDADALAVHADWLQDTDDERGDRLARCLRSNDPLLDNGRVLSSRLETVVRGQVTVDLRWTYARALAVDCPYRIQSATDAMALELSKDDYRFLEALELRIADAFSLVNMLNLPALRRLKITANQDEAAPNVDVPGLLARLPRLRQWEVFGVPPPRCASGLIGITHLTLDRADAWLDVIANTHTLRELSLASASADVLDRLSSTTLSRLERLTLGGGEIRLRSLRNKHGPRELCVDALPLLAIDDLLAIRGIERLRVREGLPRGWAQRLETHGIEVHAGVRAPPTPHVTSEIEMTKLVHITENSSFFWEIGLRGKVLFTHSGVMGSAGQHTANRDAQDPNSAREEMERQIREKIGLGYVRHG